MTNNSLNIPPEILFNLFDEPFFAYCIKNHTVTMCNTHNTFLDDGTFPLDEVIAHLRSHLPETDMPSLISLESHLEKGSDNFSLTFGFNFVNESRSVKGVIVRGTKVKRPGEDDYIVGRIHPRSTRATLSGDDLAHDSLTGLINKVDIAKLAIDRVDTQHKKGTYIAIVDIDYFKYVNDSYGHQYGDYVLSQVADIVRTEVGKDGLVGRFGGDEIFILFTEPLNMAALRDHMQNIRVLVCETFKNKGPFKDSPISISAGIACYPTDADNYNDLFIIADFCLYLAKEKGRNRYIIYTPEKHPPLSEMKNIREQGVTLINGRDNLPPGEALVQIQYMLVHEPETDAKLLLTEFAKRFKIPFLMLAFKDTKKIVISAGEQVKEAAPYTDKILEGIQTFPELTKLNGYGLCAYDDLKYIEGENTNVIEYLSALSIISLITIPFKDARGRNMILFFGSFGKNLVWNRQHFIHYSLLADALSKRSF